MLGLPLEFNIMVIVINFCRSEILASLDTSPSAVHEFRIPPKALLGLHSYCPVHFDAFHAVLVDVSIHTSLLKVGSSMSPLKVPRFVAYATKMDNLVAITFLYLQFLRIVHYCIYLLK